MKHPHVPLSVCLVGAIAFVAHGGADFDGNGLVDVLDLIEVLINWPG